jgi:hypothetical protein
MIDEREVKNKNTGIPLTGYTIEAHNWRDGSVLADYAANTYSTLIGAYTSEGTGKYNLDITTTCKAVLILKSGVTALQKIPQTANSFLKLEGNNQLDIAP